MRLPEEDAIKSGLEPSRSESACGRTTGQLSVACGLGCALLPMEMLTQFPPDQDFFFKLGVWFLYNIVLISAGQWSEPDIRMHISPPPGTFLPLPPLPPL